MRWALDAPLAASHHEQQLALVILRGALYLKTVLGASQCLFQWMHMLHLHSSFIHVIAGYTWFLCARLSYLFNGVGVMFDVCDRRKDCVYED